MAGIKGSHASSLAPMVPGVAESQANMQQLAEAKPIPMQAPQVPQALQPTAEPMPQPDIAQATSVQMPEATPSLDEIFSANEKPSLDEIFSEKPKDKSWYEVSPEGAAKGVINALPTIGGIAGGALGAMGGAAAGLGIGAAPAGVVGAGLGEMAGKSAADSLNKAFYPENAPQTRKEMLMGWKDAFESGAVGQVLGEGAGKIITKIPKLASAAIEKSAGVSEWGLKTYGEFAREVNKVLDSYGKVLDGASDDIKRSFRDAVVNTRKGLSDQITHEVNNSNKKVSMRPVIDTLTEMIEDAGKATEERRGADITELENLRLAAQNIGDGTAAKMADVKEVHKFKMLTQEDAEGAYNKTTGSYPQAGKGSYFERGAKAAASKARQIVGDALPKVGAANKRLQELHQLEDEISSTVMSAKSTDASLVAAGRGASPKSVADLKALGKLTGSDPLQAAKIYAAAKEFGGAGAGWRAQGVKMAIDHGLLPIETIRKLGGDTAINKMLSTPYGVAYLGQAIEKSYQALQGDKGAKQDLDKHLKNKGKPVPVDHPAGQ